MVATAKTLWRTLQAIVFSLTSTSCVVALQEKYNWIKLDEITKSLCRRDGEGRPFGSRDVARNHTLGDSPSQMHSIAGEEHVALVSEVALVVATIRDMVEQWVNRVAKKIMMGSELDIELGLGDGDDSDYGQGRESLDWHGLTGGGEDQCTYAKLHLWLQVMRGFGCETRSTWSDTQGLMLVLSWAGDAGRRGSNWIIHLGRKEEFCTSTKK